MSKYFELLCVACLFFAPIGAACDLNVHDNTVNIPNAKVELDVDADVNDIRPGQSVPITLKVDNVFLVEPSQTPPPGHAADAAHLQIYFDELSTPPLLATAQAHATVTIPADAKPGPHKLRCRVHKHDGTPTSVVVDVAITVSIGPSTDAGTPPPTDGGSPDGENGADGDTPGPDGATQD